MYGAINRLQEAAVASDRGPLLGTPNIFCLVLIIQRKCEDSL